MTLLDIDVVGYDVLLLDRDGVINQLRPNDYVKCWEEFEFLPGVLEALSIWSKYFKYIFIITNQRGVGRGVMTETDLKQIHERMIHEIEAYGGRIDRIYYCIALSDTDSNRKPNKGMFLQILHDYPSILREDCLMVGDSDSDMLFAKNCGISGIKI